MNVNDFMIYDIIIVAIISIIFYAALFYAWFSDGFKGPLKQIPKQLKKEIKDTWKYGNKFLIVFIVFSYAVGIPVMVQLFIGFSFIGLIGVGNLLIWLFALL